MTKVTHYKMNLRELRILIAKKLSVPVHTVTELEYEETVDEPGNREFSGITFCVKEAVHDKARG